MWLVDSNFDIRTNLKNAVLFGGCGVILVLLSAFFPIKLILCFSALPLFVAYLAYGASCGIIASILTTIALFLTFSLEIAFDAFANTIAPTTLLGYLSTKNIIKGKKVWWYPESFMLQHFVILSVVLNAILTVAFYSEEALIKAFQEAAKTLFKSENAFFVHQYLKPCIKYSIGIGAITCMCSTLLNFSLAHFIVKKMKKNIRPSFDVKNIKIHNILAILPLVSLTLANAFSCLSFVCSVIFVIGLFAPIANGFLTIYRFADKVNKNRTLISFYFALSVFTLPTIAVVIVLGVVDSFFPIARC